MAYTSTAIDTFENIMLKADGDCLRAFFPANNEIFLDIDRPDGEITPRVSTMLEQAGYKIISTLKTTSKSGNTHFYLRLSNDIETTPIRILLQSLLGSDPVKEALSLARVNNGSEATIAMFETQEQADRVIAWRTPPVIEDDFPF